jgi:hypothetical protein
MRDDIPPSSRSLNVLLAMDYPIRIVAFIDILGFSTLVSRLEKEDHLHSTLQNALLHIRSYQDFSKFSDNVYSSLQVSCFSDSIAISADPSDLTRIIWAAGWLQATLLKEGIATRGGISQGRLVHSEILLYGEGLIKAYNLESKCAIYPRIIFDPGLAIPPKVMDRLISEDSDGLRFIDIFALDAGLGSDDAELAADGWDPHELYLKELGESLQREKGLASSIDQRSKWSWLETRYNAALTDYLETRKLRVWHQ